MSTLRQALAAEFAGTFALVLVGCGAIMVNALGGGLGHVGVSLAFGLVIAAMIYATGHVSGAHFNPAVTVALAATGRFQRARAMPYIGAQVLGACAAAFLLRGLLGPVAHVGSTQVAPFLTLQAGVLVEIAFTALLVYVIVGVTSKGATPGAAGAAIGATVALAALVAGPLTGASMNPARSIGPALASLDGGALAILPLYVVATIAGGLLGALAHGGWPGTVAAMPEPQEVDA